MPKNREVSQFGSYISVDDTTKNVGIGTTLKISSGGIFVGNTEIVRPDGTWNVSHANGMAFAISRIPREEPIFF